MYSSVIDVRLALTPGAKSDDKETAAGFADSQLIDAIAEADGVIKTYLNRYYTIPTANVEVPDPASTVQDPLPNITVVAAPYPVRGWSRDIAAYLAQLTFRKHKDLPEDDPIRLRFGMAMANLDLVRKRGILLDPTDFPPTDTGASQSGVFVENTYEGKLFDAEDFGLVAGGVSRPGILWPYEQP